MTEPVPNDARRVRAPERDGGHGPASVSAAERSLVSRVRLGDQSAFEELFRTYYQALYEIALQYLPSHADAEDVAQEVLGAVWAHRDTWEVRQSVRAYLFTAARHVALSRVRKERVRARLVASHEQRREGCGEADADVVVPGMSSQLPAPDAAVMEKDFISVLRGAMRTLSERRREVLALRWERGLSHAEISQVLGISTRGVEQLHARALRSLRALLAHLRD
jgi:RNA polymerase sigma-70 factor (family 1)